MARLFISCVSHEFAHYRDALRRDFTRPNLDTKIQEDFIASSGATLSKLDDYIRQCDAVIHICGDMTGSMANDISLQYINDTYKDWGKRYPALLPVLNGTEQMSYTQWEAWLAIYHCKPLFIAAPTADAKRDDRYVKETAQVVHQQAHLNRLRQQGHYDEIQFGSEDNLGKQLYRSPLGNIIYYPLDTQPYNLPYQSIGPAFKGRAADLQALTNYFAAQQGAPKCIALHALGGMGKTRLAIEYALAHRKHYTALLFVQAAEAEWLTTNLANLSAPDILNLSEHTATDERIKYAAVIQWLNTYSGWLLILDNADTPAAAKAVEALFGSLRQGHVLITSRLSHWSLQIQQQELHLLSPEAAEAFLLETTDSTRAKRPDDSALAAQIADDLGYLALALEQARAYIYTNHISLADYRQKWEANRLGVLQWYDAQQMQYDYSVAITWQTSFDQLSPQAVDLLNRLAWLAPDPIPRSLLIVDIPDVEPIDMQVAWAELKKYSLASSAADKQSFTVHRLVQDITRSRMDTILAEQTLNLALGWLDAVFVGDSMDINNWPVLEPLVPHVLLLLEYAEKLNIANSFTRLMNDLANLFYTKAQYALAEPLYRRALVMEEASLGPNHPKMAIRLNNLAQLLQATNRLPESEPLMRRALAIDEASFGPNHPNVATGLNNLAQLLKATNRLPEAEPLLRKALTIDEATFGPNHPNVAIDLNNLALLLQATNRLPEAEPLMRRALKIDETSFGPDHPAVARDVNNLALLLKATNRLYEAEPLYRRALEIYEASLGSSHPNVATGLNNLAQLLQTNNRLPEAEPLMRRALEIDEASFGPNHPNVAIRLNNLAHLLTITNRLKEAEPLYRRALAIDEASFGPNHPHVARNLNNLAQFLQDTNRLQEAEPLYIRALAIDEASFGPNHPNVAIRLNNLAALLQDTNRLPEAAPLMERSLVIFIQSLGTAHPNSVTVSKNYHILLQEMGKSEEEIAGMMGNLL